MISQQEQLVAEVKQQIRILIDKLGARIWFDSRASFAQTLKSKMDQLKLKIMSCTT